MRKTVKTLEGYLIMTDGTLKFRDERDDYGDDLDSLIQDYMCWRTYSGYKVVRGPKVRITIETVED